MKTTAPPKRPSLIQAAKGQAMLDRYDDGKLYYDLIWSEPAEQPPEQHNLHTGDAKSYTFTFSVDVKNDAAATGAFTSRMHGIGLMRWVRQEFDRLDAEAEMIAAAKANWNPENPAE